MKELRKCYIIGRVPCIDEQKEVVDKLTKDSIIAFVDVEEEFNVREATEVEIELLKTIEEYVKEVNDENN